MKNILLSLILCIFFSESHVLIAVGKDTCEYKSYQFPEGKLPSIDGLSNDWENKHRRI